MRRTLHTLLLVFAFLFAQAGMATHAASHMAHSPAHDHGLPSEAGCDLCVGYAQLGAGVPLSQPPSLPVCSAQYQRPVASRALPVAQAFFYALARAPPVFS